ncbi:MAG: hypothetical protein ACRC9Q_01935 [Bacteroidales bacterium]
MGYLPISRELLNSSFWRSLAPAEKGILVDLMAMAAYKPTTYNLYGAEIELNKFEFCFSVLKMAEKYRVTEYAIRSLIKKLENAKILTKISRKITREVSQGNSRCEYVKKTTCCYTSVTFYAWVFDVDCDVDSTDIKKDEFHEAPQTEFQTENHEHNKEVFNKEVLKQKIHTQSAREKNFSFPDGRQKKWYPVEAIANLEVPNGEELLKSWCVYSVKDEEKVKAFLQKYAKAQLLIDIQEMTLDIFDHRFRKAMKREFNIRENKPAEKEEFIRYLN